MGKRTQLNQADMLRVMRHLADVAALKGNPPGQRQHLIDGLNALVGTDSSFFYVADEWRVGRRPHFTHTTVNTNPDPLFGRYIGEFGIRFPLDCDPYCYSSIRDDAPVQAWKLRDVLPDIATQRRHADFITMMTSGRYRDGMISHFRGGHGGDRIVGLAMHRLGQSRLLIPREVALVRFAVTEMKSLVERGHLVLPSLDDADTLPPRLQQVLDLLLAGHAPKGIARHLGLSVWTVREHIARLYKHFDISGREELMARFIR